jgi:prefoldin subunit 5
MENNFSSRDKALEAIDFIIDTLKSHEKNLDEYIFKLGTITEQTKDLKNISKKINKLDDGLEAIQKEIGNISVCIPNATIVETGKLEKPSTESELTIQTGPHTIINCNDWLDFQALAMHTPIIFFNLDNSNKVFQVTANKGTKIIKYSGSIPELSSILPDWLSQQTGIPRQRITEGSILPTKDGKEES